MHRHSYTPERSSVGKARAFTATQLHEYPEEFRSTAILVVSELSTNAVLHAQTSFEVTIDPRADRVLLTLADQNPTLPAKRQPAIEGSGYGLRIIDQLAEHWGIDERDGGKSIWCLLSKIPDPTDVELGARETKP